MPYRNRYFCPALLPDRRRLLDAAWATPERSIAAMQAAGIHVCETPAEMGEKVKPVYFMSLERTFAIIKPDAVAAGHTEPSYRKQFATDIERNCVHGSDAVVTEW